MDIKRRLNLDENPCTLPIPFLIPYRPQLAFSLNKVVDKIEELEPFLEGEATPVFCKQKRVQKPLLPFWCRICNKEVDATQDTFLHFSTLRHLASKSHRTAVKNYWKENGVGNMLPKKMVCVPSASWKKYIRRVKEKTLELEEEKATGPSCLVRAMGETTEDTMTLQNDKEDEKEGTKEVPSVQIRSGVQTVAVASGLKRINTPKLLPGEGNIRTGAPPPWLLVTTGSTSNSARGRSKPRGGTRSVPPPEEAKQAWGAEQKAKEEGEEVVVTVAAFPGTHDNTAASLDLLPYELKLLPKRKNRKKKNPNRVGAKFVEQKHLLEYNEKTWLPSFGGVWSSAPRSQYKRQFREAEKQQDSKEWKQTAAQGEKKRQRQCSE